MSVPGQTSATDATEAVNQQHTENVVGGIRCNTPRVSGSVVTNFVAMCLFSESVIWQIEKVFYRMAFYWYFIIHWTKALQLLLV